MEEICKFILRLVWSEYLIFHVELWPNMWWVVATKKSEIIFGKNIAERACRTHGGGGCLHQFYYLVAVWLTMAVNVLLFLISSRNYEAEREKVPSPVFIYDVDPAPPCEANQWRQTRKILPNIQRMSPRRAGDAYQDLNNHNSILEVHK